MGRSSLFYLPSPPHSGPHPSPLPWPYRDDLPNLPPHHQEGIDEGTRRCEGHGSLREERTYCVFRRCEDNTGCHHEIDCSSWLPFPDRKMSGTDSCILTESLFASFVTETQANHS